MFEPLYPAMLAMIVMAARDGQEENAVTIQGIISSHPWRTFIKRM